MLTSSNNKFKNAKKVEIRITEENGDVSMFCLYLDDWKLGKNEIEFKDTATKDYHDYELKITAKR